MWPHMQRMWSNALFTAVGTISQKQRQLQTLLCEAYRWAASALPAITEAPGNSDCLGLA